MPNPQTLTTNIVLSATGQGFASLGNTITALGYQVNQLSQQVINFGKESLEIDSEFEKNMTEAMIALSKRDDYTEGLRILSGDMDTLTKKAAEWAGSTIFNTKEVSGAIRNAARAGWDYETIIANMPSVMQLAEAGSMSLDEALSYAADSMLALGLTNEEMPSFINQWIFAANSANGSVSSFGDTMLRLGSIMRLTGNTEEMFALIAAMHNMGTKGAQAGTLLRNAIMRLIAPTDTAQEMLDGLDYSAGDAAESMEELGYTTEEFERAEKILAENGFNAYDSEGKLRPILDIYKDLATITDSLTEEEDINLLNKVFGLRGIQGATNILNSLTEAEELRDRMLNGEAEGYGLWAAEQMANTLWGQTKLYESKQEELKRRTGETLKEEWIGVLNAIGQVIDGLNTMDDGQFQALVRGMEVIAAAGPGLLLVGGAFKLLGTVLSPAGALGLGIIAVTAFVEAMKEMENQEFMDKFGDMSFDKEGVKSYVQTIGEEFKEAYTETSNFATALNTAKNNFKTASSTFSAGLLDTLLKGGTLTEAEKLKLTNLGTEMYNAVEDALAQRAAKSLSFWNALYSEGGEKPNESEEYQNLVSTTSAAYQAALLQAEAIGQNLRDAMNKAFEDGELSDEEAANIRSYVIDYNRVMAEAAASAADEENAVQMQKWLLKAQGASFEDMMEIARVATAERDQILADAEEMYLDEYARAMVNGADEAALADAEERFKNRQARASAAYDDFLLTLWSSTMQTSELGGSMENVLGWVSEMYRPSSGLTQDDIQSWIYSKYGENYYLHTGADKGNETSQMARMLGLLMLQLGGDDAVMEKIAMYRANGNADMANRLQKLYTAEQIINGFGTTQTGKTGFLNLFDTDADISVWDGRVGTSYNEDKIERSLGTYEWTAEELAKVAARAEGFNSVLTTTLGIVSGQSHEQNEQEQKERLSAELSALGQWLGTKMYYLHSPYGNGWDVEGAALEPDVDTTEAHEKMHRIFTDAQTYADNNPLQEDTNLPSGYEKAAEFTNSAQAYLNEHPLRQQWIEEHTGSGLPGYAEGGRATRASIFGEGSVAEWAIPEEHSARTAELLNAARAASGFTWPDLLARFGGLNANANHTPATYVYSPTINAQDASGVAAALQEDRRRFERWIDERERREGIEVYA